MLQTSITNLYISIDVIISLSFSLYIYIYIYITHSLTHSNQNPLHFKIETGSKHSKKVNGPTLGHHQHAKGTPKLPRNKVRF